VSDTSRGLPRRTPLSAPAESRVDSGSFGYDTHASEIGAQTPDGQRLRVLRHSETVCIWFLETISGDGRKKRSRQHSPLREQRQGGFVSITLNRGGERAVLRASFVVGCDWGAHRTGLGSVEPTGPVSWSQPTGDLGHTRRRGEFHPYHPYRNRPN
jgi:hypothetical protein